jgi:hypothetical protein
MNPYLTTAVVKKKEKGKERKKGRESLDVAVWPTNQTN